MSLNKTLLAMALGLAQAAFEAGEVREAGEWLSRAAEAVEAALCFGWIDGKGNPREVTLCNGSRMCGRYQYIKLSGMFQRLGTRFPDPKYGNCGTSANCLPM